MQRPVNRQAMNRTPISAAKALDRLETLCARSEQCTFDLRRKLYRWGVGQRDADRIVASLERNRFVDDARFAHAYVLEKVRCSRWGRVKVRVGLLAKRIDRDIIDEAMEEEIDEREYRDNLLEVMRAKRRTVEDADSYEGKTRLFRYGISRGYESAEVVKVLKGEALWRDEGY